jgi:hypothetical protein
MVATELVGPAVGTSGLVAAVPTTTLLAAWHATGRPAGLTSVTVAQRRSCLMRSSFAPKCG